MKLHISQLCHSLVCQQKDFFLVKEGRKAERKGRREERRQGGRKEGKEGERDLEPQLDDLCFSICLLNNYSKNKRGLLGEITVAL